MIRICTALLFLAALCWAQQKMPEAEEKDLRDSLATAGRNPTEMIRAFEKHLEKYPNSVERAGLELVLAKTAIEANDKPRIVLYGSKVLDAGEDDLQLLERVTRALLSSDDKPSNERALKYSLRMQATLKKYAKENKPPEGSEARFQEEMDRATGRALVFQARATGNLGNPTEAVTLASKGYEAYPTAEAAREVGKWLAVLGKNDEAVQRYADAFIDLHNNDADRAKDRLHMSEIYRKLHDSDQGLGEYVIKAYDRTSALAVDRRLKLQKLDPNAQVTNPMEYTITDVAGEKLPLASLRGKIVILDFWATWCGPCRIQHPLFEQVKEHFKNRDDIVFLPVATDEDHSLVKPFLQSQKWQQHAYFEDGLAALLQVSSIPTTMIFDKQGQLVSRMNGFLPEVFAGQLTDRISELLRQPQ